MTNYDILFLGKLFPREKEKEIKSKMRSGMQDAANALQWNIIDGLDANNCGTIKILDNLPVDSYPGGYSDRHIDEYVFQHTKKYRSDDKIVGCTNVTVIKQFLDFAPFKREAVKWAETNSQRKKVVVLYTASLMFCRVAEYIKKHYNEITVCCIIADLPEFACARELHGIHKYYNKYQNKRIRGLYKHIDRFVLLTEQMAKRLDITVPYTVVEGISPELNTFTDNSVAERFKNEKYILYTGTLNYEFGIEILLKAFSHINKNNIKLIICGFGEAEAAIKNSGDPSIIYLGKLDRSQVLPLQKNAAVLVNPRQNNGEFTKYSFPSKTMEYLASGVPVAAYKLDGIPKEYDEYIKYVPDNSPEALAEVLSEICNMPEEERKQMGERAKRFIFEEKNNIKQSKKILDLIK